MAYREFMATSVPVTGWSAMHSLMLQVPVMVHTCPGRVTALAMAQASTSNMPPATGVPGSRPVSRAAASVTWPQRSQEPFSGVSIS